MSRHWNGSPIFHFSFKDVKTGDAVILRACYYNEEISNALGEYYYEEITDATTIFDILWNLSNERISVLAESFEKVQEEYLRMIQEGISSSDINLAMINFYKGKSRVKL